jgi:hypothetical protein
MGQIRMHDGKTYALDPTTFDGDICSRCAAEDFCNFDARTKNSWKKGCCSMDRRSKAGYLYTTNGDPTHFWVEVDPLYAALREAKEIGDE